MRWGHFSHWQEPFYVANRLVLETYLKVQQCPSIAQWCQLCHGFAVQQWCPGHWLCWYKKGNCTRSSALKTNEVPTARLVEETLRALVVTRPVGVSQNWGETCTCFEPIWQPEGNCHRCPSHCLPCAICSSKFWWFLTNADFVTFEVRIETKVLGLDMQNTVDWIV